jgi:sulfur-carrier protein
MTLRLKYFAWVREKLGRSDEVVELPATVQTVGALMAWLALRGDAYADVFERHNVVRAAMDKRHVEVGQSITGAREIAFFPPVTGG